MKAFSEPKKNISPKLVQDQALPTLLDDFKKRQGESDNFAGSFLKTSSKV